MPNTKTSISLFSASLVIALTAAWFCWQRATTDRDALLALAEQQTHTRDEIRALQRRVASETENQRTLHTTATSSSALARSPKSKLQTPVARGISDLLRDQPVIQAKWLNVKRAEIRTSYNPFFRKQKLSSDQIRAFEENALKREEEIMDFHAVASTRGLTPKDPAYGEMWGQQLAVYDASQLAALGDVAFAQWKEYERTIPVQDMVSGFAGTAVLMGEPYTPQQIDELVQAVAKADPKYRKGQAADLSSVDWTSADLDAQKILSPEQFTLFTSTEPRGPTGASARHHNQFWALVSKAQRAEAKETADR